MQVVLVFRQKVFGYRFTCGSKGWEKKRISLEKRLFDYVRSNTIEVERIVEKIDRTRNVSERFLGFIPKEIDFFEKNLCEEEIEAGKYLRMPCFKTDFDKYEVIEKMRKFMGENNILTDGLQMSQYAQIGTKFGSGNLYLRIKN